MQHPDKWRETAEPFAIRFQNFKLERILGYPHAGNDVFHVEGIWKNRRCLVFSHGRPSRPGTMARLDGADHVPRCITKKILEAVLAASSFIYGETMV